ncbi:DUF4244 domain-containing protein [Amycolatopsis albispora]|uniref:DUF4244 domain-containing protein n=1 Tax=Amycolatopsis albispora TaxID=1804986 RepID=UPI000DE2CF95|nr:DUF4244 domain-containing protein [Amycolatopsis albispora]
MNALELHRDAGSAAVEYTVVILVAAALAAVLFKLVTGGMVVDLLAALVEDALEAPG